MPLPADLLVTDKDKSKGEGKVVRKLKPQKLDSAIQHSQVSQLPMMPILRQGKPAKPENGWLLNQSGIAAYLGGETLTETHITKHTELWGKEFRIGIGLNCDSRTADEGKLFTVEHTVPQQPENKGITAGLVVGIANGDDLPESGFIRLGGDGRAAEFSLTDAPAINAIPKSATFKLVLLTPVCLPMAGYPTVSKRKTAHIGSSWMVSKPVLPVLRFLVQKWCPAGIW